MNATEDDDDDDGKHRQTSSRDIAISVFPMEDIQDVLQYLVVLGNTNLGSPKEEEEEEDEGQINTTSTDDSSGSSSTKKSLTIRHARDRSNVEYATSSILAKLSIDDCDEGMIRDICRLYHVDVELMRWLGFGGDAVERC